jgi:hypothetical protein
MTDAPEHPPAPQQPPAEATSLWQRARWRRPKPSDEELQDRRIKNWAELWATVILSLATLVTAWAGYESSKWNGLQTAMNLQATALRIESGLHGSEAQQMLLYDVGLFTNWANAVGTSNSQLADFYRARFRDEFVPAFDAWLATQPLQNDAAPASPFEMDAYHPAALDAQEEVAAAAEAQVNNAEVAGNIADRYTLLIVILAGALLLAGLAHRFEWAELRGLVVLVALLVLLYCVVALLRLPVI